MSVKKIKEHWGHKAKEFIQKPNGKMGNTLYDENLRSLEINSIQKYITSGSKVLDVGCGNGFSTIQFANENDIIIDGMDYSKEMINNANTLLGGYPLLSNRIRFFIGDIMEGGYHKKYDIVITERCLINLETWGNQQKAILNIKKMLKDKGKLIMLEGFEDNLNDLNQVRKNFNLEPIKVVWHNLFFNKKKFESFILPHFKIDQIDNFGSTYMLITRSLFHAISNTFDKDIDYLATLLPNMGDYNYQKLYILSKI
jgi:2-polyprenyl-3-methyl-5-hydroxy-6-metoxy-1,4-benzoquinol methylase